MSVRLYSLATELDGLSESTRKACEYKVTYACLVGQRRIYQTTSFTVLGDENDDLDELASEIISCINALSQGKIVKIEAKIGHARNDEQLVDVGDRRGYATLRFDALNCDRSGTLGIPFPKTTANEQAAMDLFGDYVNEGTPESSKIGLVTWNSRDNPTALMTHAAQRLYKWQLHAGQPKLRNVNPTFNDAVGTGDNHIGGAEAS